MEDTLMSEQKLDHYEIDSKELMARFRRVVDAYATGGRAADVRFYEGVILARMEGKRPPYKHGERVVVCDELGTPSLSLVPFNCHRLPFGQEHVVSRVWYIRGDWYLELKDNDVEGPPPKYPAIGFKPLKVKAESMAR